MDDTKTKLLVFGLVITVFAVIALTSVYKARPEYYLKKAEAEKYYLKYSIQLKGIITNKRPVDIGAFPSNYFTYTVKITESNFNEHDVREYLEDYYLLVKNDTAKFVNHLNSGGEIGDSLLINYKTGKQYIWKGQEKPDIDDLPVFEIHYNRMRQKGLGR